MPTTTPTQDLLDQRWEVALDDFITVTDIIGSGDRVLAGSLSGRAEILDAKTGETIAPLDGHAMGVLSGAWSPDGTSVATAGHDARLRLYRAADLAPTASVALDGWGTTLARSWPSASPPRSAPVPATGLPRRFGYHVGVGQSFLRARLGATRSGSWGCLG